MRLRAYKRLGGQTIIDTDVSMLVVEGAEGQPIMVAADLGNGAVLAEVLKPSTEAEFNRTLRALGVDKMVIAEDLGKKVLPPGQHNRLPLITGRE